MFTYRSRWLELLAGIIAICTIVLIGMYFFNIMSGGFTSFSDNPAEWAIFGTFISPIFSLISIIVILLSISINNKNLEKQRQADKERDELNYRTHKLDELLTLVYECYSIVNKAFNVRTELHYADAMNLSPEDIKKEKNRLHVLLSDFNSISLSKVGHMSSLTALHFSCVNGRRILHILDHWYDIIAKIGNEYEYEYECSRGNEYIKEYVEDHILLIKKEEYSEIDNEVTDSELAKDVNERFHNKTNNVFVHNTISLGS